MSRPSDDNGNNLGHVSSDKSKSRSPVKPLSRSEEQVCSAHYATVTEFSSGESGTSRTEIYPSVYKLIYSVGPKAIMEKYRAPLADGTCFFRWYHLPANNMTWCKDLICRIYENADPRIISKINEGWTKREYRGITPHSRFIRPTSREILNGLQLDGRPEAEGTMLFFMPFLRRDVMQPAHDLGSRLPLTSELPAASLNAMPLDAHPDFHIRRTLDQYYYYFDSTTTRDRDQVVYRFQQKMIPSAAKEQPKIIIVDQLWLWILNEDCIVSSFPDSRWNGNHSFPDHDDIVRDSFDAAHLSQSCTVYELAARIANSCIDNFNYEGTYQTSKIVDLYAEVLQPLSREGELLYEDAIRLTNDLNSAEMSEKKQKLILFMLTSRQKENEILSALRDARDELEIISLLQEDQQRVIRDMGITIGRKDDQEFQAAYRRLKHELEDQVVDVANLLKLAARISVDINRIVELKQSAIIANEAQYSLTTSRNLAAESSKQGKIILLFTIVTIVFLPMSFLAAFFAIPIVEYPKAADGSSGLHLSWVCKYVFGLTAAVAVPLITLGYNFERFKRWWAFTYVPEKGFDEENLIPQRG